MKTKLFFAYYPEKKKAKTIENLELEINGWLHENPGIEVIDMKQSSSGGSFSPSSVLISVWYK